MLVYKLTIKQCPGMKEGGMGFLAENEHHAFDMVFSGYTAV